MTFREKLESERRWNRRVMIISFYHNAMLIRADKKWSIRRTARRLGISIGAVSEAIRLCKAIMMNAELENCKTRKEALLLIARDSK